MLLTSTKHTLSLQFAIVRFETRALHAYVCKVSHYSREYGSVKCQLVTW